MTKKKNQGFSFIEVVVVALIIGVLAALAFPSFWIQMLKVKNQEAIQILTAVWEAQKDFYRDTGAYAPSTDQLAINVPNLKNFDLYIYMDDSVFCSAWKRRLAAAVPKGNAIYTLHVLEDGRVVCTPCGGAICYKMGFEDNW